MQLESGNGQSWLLIYNGIENKIETLTGLNIMEYKIRIP